MGGYGGGGRGAPLAPNVDPGVVAKYLAEFFFKVPVDTVPPFAIQHYHKPLSIYKLFDGIKKDWWQVYNFLEFVVNHCRNMNPSINPEKFRQQANDILERENSGYRFVGDQLAPITNKEEMVSIEEAIQEAESRGFTGTKRHLDDAISLLSKKPAPDYRNSIKESISAIESLSKQITGEESGGLDRALTCLNQKVHFHGAFKSGLLSLYGYTSDKDGIRHAILDESDVGFDEAKFMLVSCSAFVNFIIMKAEKAGILAGKQ